MEFIKSLTKTLYWNPRAKFVIILNKKPNNLFVVLKMYTSFPYISSIRLEERTEPFLVDWCYMGKLQKQINLFPNKLPKAWKDFTVRVLLMEYPPYVICRQCDDGDKKEIEIRTLKLVKRILGFNIRYVKRYFPTWGYLLSNGSYSEAYGYLQRYRADLAIGIFSANYTQSLHFDLSFPYLEDTYRWVVPAAKKQPSWKNIVKIFRWNVWLLICISLFCASLTTYHIGSRLLDYETYREFSKCFLTCFQCLLGQCVYRQPTTLTLRVSFVLWVFLSWLIALGFQSHLIMALNFSSYEKHISSVKEVIDAKLKIGFYDLLASLFAGKDSDEDTYIYKNFVFCPLGNSCLNKTAFQRDFVTIKVGRYLDNIIHECYLDKGGRPLVHVWNRELLFMPINMVFAKGFPLYGDINNVLLQLKSNGFIERNYRKESQFAKEILRKSQSVNMQADVLDANEMQGIFVVLFLGWFVVCNSVYCRTCFKARNVFE